MDTNGRLNELRNLMKKSGIGALLIRSTDRYFNEYVPEYLSPRVYFTNFKGSLGDALITHDEAHLFVDGRYELQAHTQALGFIIHVCKNNLSIESSWLDFLSKNLKSQSLCYDPATIDIKLSERLLNLSTSLGAELKPQAGLLFEQLFKPTKPKNQALPRIWEIPLAISGQSTQEKLQKIALKLEEHKLQGFLAVKLDDIAWLLNCRGNAFSFQQTFPSIALLMPDKILLGLAQDWHLPTNLDHNYIKTCQEKEFFKNIKNSVKNLIIGIDENETSKEHETALRSADIEIKSLTNPLSLLKALKNEQELLNMRSAFKKADQVIHKAQAYVSQCYEEGQRLSEGEIDDQLKSLFSESGSHELSFRPICASGENGAIIHYGTPDREQKIERGSLFLLDCGAYYEGGYATDLTRTFLVGPKNTPAQAWQKKMFTLVLKASIKGMSARFRQGLLGMQLDAIVRAPLWQAGLDYAHGTGHGVGINVHEFPPRIGPTSQSPLYENQVFSIEPGLYFKNVGGVRIENLVSVVSDPKAEGFLRILPLTFCPLDSRLIDQDMLDSYEQEFLAYYLEQWHSSSAMPALPPTPPAPFVSF